MAGYTDYLNRFIPTCVGYTSYVMREISRMAVHPHVRGVYGHAVQPVGGVARFIPTCVGYTSDELLAYTEAVRFIPTCVGYTAHIPDIKSGKDGSSPRAWGILTLVHPQDGEDRFIPTCVGYTAHIPDIKSGKDGSSPRAWGILTLVHPQDGEDRFIPTCVGYTCTPVFSSPDSSVHPHVRGVY